jgi:hypothetical protein
VRADIQGRRVEDVVVLPRSVLRPDNTVLIANDEQQLEIRPVAVLRAEPRDVYIREGVADGEWVITTSLDAPIPGMALVIGTEPDESTPDAAGSGPAVADAEPGQ